MKNAENEWSEKILTITMKIKDEYPELSKYLTEMPETIPDENDPEITLKNLKVYFESLSSLLNNYILEEAIRSASK